MQKIVVFSNMYPSSDHPTYGIFVKNQVALLKSAGLDVAVVAIEEPGKGKFKTLQKYAGWFFRSLAYLLKHKKKLSMTHAHYAFPTGLLSLIGKKWLGLPFVVTVHGGDIDKMAARSARIAKMTKSILQQAEAVIVVGEKLRTDVIGKFGVPENRVHLISMGVDTDVFKPILKPEAKETLGFPKDKRIILFVGNVIRAKGLLELAEAFGKIKPEFPNTVLFIAGSQKDENFTAELRQFIETQSIKDVQFKGPLSQSVLARWMAAADVLALPSHHEGFGLVALEAMAAGTTVVGTDVGGLSYLLANQAGILVQPKQPDSLADGLRKALDHSSAHIDENKMKETVELHSYDRILHNLFSIYEAVGKDGTRE
ncbi:glycosyltransferase [Bacillus sp. OxB-1]|uniref:glycosyltransferase n=1 Tax=Bacillus sp. (strain OxB-1) TaxID=98228 RepID=UPI000581C5EA|nr:glycosyltransferase [Bacillus sp. OxB-1]BAQ10106.1 glycosyltransferase [Bacillus sp. OxB-1]